MNTRFKITLLFLMLISFSFKGLAQKGVEDGSMYGHGQDSINCIKNLSLFFEFNKQKNYKDAVIPWREVFRDCPTSREYLYGTEMFKYFIENTTDEKLKSGYIDTILLIHDQRIKYFGNEGKVLGLKGVDVLRYRRTEGIEFIKLGYDILKKSIEIEKVKSSPAVLTTFITSGVSLFLVQQLEGEQLINDYIIALDIIENQLKRGPSSKTLQAKEYINNNIKDSKVLTCESVVSIFTPKFESNKDNIEFLKLVSGFLKDAQCETEDLFSSTSERLYELEPSSESAYNLARLFFFKQKDYEKAKLYYIEAIKGAANDSSKATYNYELGILYFSYLKQPQSAVESATEAIRLKSGWGEPYLLMGQAYIAGKNLISDNFQQQTIHWIAVDMFQKAKSIDPSVAEKANTLIKEYSNFFPTKEEIFFQTLVEGQSYTVGGWINKTTTVRAR